MLLQGIVLLVAGVGIVFSFLTLLVGVMTLSAKIVPRFNHILPDAAPKAKKTTKSQTARPAADDEAVAVAIAAAILRQRSAA